MDFGERVEFDFDDLEAYFSLISAALKASPEWSYRSSTNRFDMVTNIYGCLEFWFKEICTRSKNKYNANLGYKDIRADNDLAVYYKYMKDVVSYDMSPVKGSYDKLQDLRKVRNIIIHHGSHTLDESIGTIQGIRLSGTLIVVSQEFISSSIKSAKALLLHAKNA
jgi:hypothetical protein